MAGHVQPWPRSSAVNPTDTDTDTDLAIIEAITTTQTTLAAAPGAATAAACAIHQFDIDTQQPTQTQLDLIPFTRTCTPPTTADVAPADALDTPFDPGTPIELSTPEPDDS